MPTLPIGPEILLCFLPWKWIGNILIMIGLWTIGYKWRHAFLFSIAGEAIWIVSSYQTGQYELCFICVVFCLLAFRNWIKWGKDAEHPSSVAE